MTDELGRGERDTRGSHGGSPRMATEVVGRRFVQFVIDTALHLVVSIPLIVLFFSYVPDLGGSPVKNAIVQLLGVLLALVILGWHFVIFVVVPLRSEGRTPGMRAQDITIVRRDGTSPGLGPLALRWVFLAVGIALGFLIPTLLVMALSPDHTRIGDKIAGTLVVWSPGGKIAWL